MAREKPADNPPLFEAFDRTMDVLAEARPDYALIGGLAVAHHGLPRPTRDIDILWSVPRVKLPSLLERFREHGFSFDLEEVLGLLGRDHLASIRYGDVRLDVLEAVIPFFRRTLERAGDVELRGRSIRMARPEDLVSLKMLAARDDDLRDVRGILAVQGEGFDLEAVRETLRECSDDEHIRLFERIVEATLR